MSTSTIGLPDGRDLEVDVSGPDGAPVLLFHHGTPGSSPPFALMARGAAERGHRLVTTSRPGYGASTRQPGRSVADVVADSAAVLDHLGVDSCVTAGWSGGGPHALACGALQPERFSRVLVIAGVAPYDTDDLDFLAGMAHENVVEFSAALAGEATLRGALEPEQPGLAVVTPEQIATSLGGLIPAVDVASLTGELAEWLSEQMRHGLATTVDGWIDDDLAFTRPWGFDLASISVPVHLWQGSEDLMVPFAHGQWLADHVPGVVPHLEQGQGHLSIGVGEMSTMLDELLR